MVETTNIEINTTKVKVPNNGLEIDAYLAQPAQKGTFGAVIVFPEIFGINSNIRDMQHLIRFVLASAVKKQLGVRARCASNAS